MPLDALQQLRDDQTLRYGIIGGLTAIPLVLGDHWLSATGTQFAINMVFFGGLLAGFLAQRSAANAERAAIFAGILGGLPGYVWMLPAIVRTWGSFATAWSSRAGATLLVLVGGVVLVGISVLAGVIGGVVGRWLAKRTGSDQSLAVGS